MARGRVWNCRALRLALDEGGISMAQNDAKHAVVLSTPQRTHAELVECEIE
jgi:hypothetical protein